MNFNKMKDRPFLHNSDFDENGTSMCISHVIEETVGNGNDAEQKYVLYFEGQEKGLVLNWTNTQMVARLTGEDDSDDWKGHSVSLYKTTTTFGSEIRDCIRVKEASGGSGDDIPF